VINALAVEPGKIAPQAAMAFFLVGAVHVALMLMMLKVGSTMVGSWTVFGMAGSGRSDSGEAAPAPAPASTPAAMTIQQTAMAAAAQPSSAPRRLAIAGVAAGMAANDAAAPRSVTVTNEKRAYATGGGQQGPLSSSTSRVRGVGSRFRSPNAAKLARSPERLT
jgi:type IV secretion system protein VirB6